MLVFNLEAVENSRIQNLPAGFGGIRSSSRLSTLQKIYEAAALEKGARERQRKYLCRGALDFGED